MYLPTMLTNTIFTLNGIFAMFSIYLLSLSVLVSSKKSGFVLKDYSSEYYLSSEESSIERKKHNLKRHQFDFSGRLRKSFALEVFLSNNFIQNMACSPVSALMPLAKLAIGAEGASGRELLEAIGVTRKAKIEHKFRKMIKELKHISGVKLNLASRIFVSDKAVLNRTFTRETSKIFKSSVERLNFDNAKETANKINAWIAKESGNSKGVKIEYKVSGIQSSIIMNIITFAGDWEHKFLKVTDKEFYSPIGVVTVPMMSRKGYYKYAKSVDLNAQLLDIPYERQKASLLVVLPFSKTGLPLLLKKLKLAPELLNAAMERLFEEKVILSLPQFRIQFNQDITPIYKSMGVRKIFSAKSGLTGIIRGQEMAVNAAWQVTIIDVNKKGTKAAAATAMELVLVSGGMDTVIFNADHPFLFYIRSANEQIFAGVYAGSD